MEEDKESQTIDIEQTIVILSMIGKTKNDLPFNLRGYLNDLGLHVQLHTKSLSKSPLDTLETLQAGGKLKACLVAEQHCCGDPEPNWKVIRFDEKTWENQFAKLVMPTFEIAYIVNNTATEQLTKEQSEIYQKVISHYKKTGEWLGLLDNIYSEERAQVELCFWQAKTYSVFGQRDEAYNELTKAITLSNTNKSKAGAYFRRGVLFLMMGKESESVSDFNTVISISENPETINAAKVFITKLMPSQIRKQVNEELGLKSDQYIEQKLSPDLQPLITKVWSWVEQDYPPIEPDKLESLQQTSKTIEHMKDDLSASKLAMEIVDHIHSAIEKKSYREAIIFDILFFLILEYQRKVIDIETGKRPEHTDKLDEIYRKQMEYQSKILSHLVAASKECQDWETLILAAGYLVLIGIEKVADEKIIQLIRDKIGEDAMRNRISDIVNRPQSIVDIYFGKILISHLDKT